MPPTNNWSVEFLRGTLRPAGDSPGTIVTTDYKGVSGTTARSIAFWLKTTARTGTLCYWGDALPTGQLTNGEQVKIMLVSGGALPGQSKVTHVRLHGLGSFRDSVADVGDGSWHHICFTWPGGDRTFAAADCFIDGSLSNGKSAARGNVDTPAGRDVTLGSEPSAAFGNRKFADCLMDDFVIFSSDIGTAGVSQLYNSGQGNIDVTTSGLSSGTLQTWYRMGDASIDSARAGGTIQDGSVQGRDGTTTAGTILTPDPGPESF